MVIIAFTKMRKSILFLSFLLCFNSSFSQDKKKKLAKFSEEIPVFLKEMNDFLNSKKVIDNLVKKETKVIEGVQFNISRKVEDGFIIKNIEVIHDKEKMSFQEKVKALTKDDFSELLTFAGLTIINTFGNYRLDDFNHQTSDRLIIRAKK